MPEKSKFLFNTYPNLQKTVLCHILDGEPFLCHKILIDCMPSLGMMTINSLVAADSIIIPAQPSFLSTKGLGLLRKSVTKVRRSINPKLTIDGIHTKRKDVLLLGGSFYGWV